MLLLVHQACYLPSRRTTAAGWERGVDIINNRNLPEVFDENKAYFYSIPVPGLNLIPNLHQDADWLNAAESEKSSLLLILDIMFMKKMSTRTASDNSVTRKSFLKQFSLSLLGLGLLPFGASSLSTGDSKFRYSAGDSGDGNEKRIRSISYNVFNGCIGYKGINGRELPPGDDSILVKTARDMGQIPKRIMLELALHQPNIINFSESPNEKVVAEMAKMLNLNYAFFPGAKNGEGHFPGSILTTYEIVSAETRPFVNKNRNDPQELFTRHWGKAKLRLPNGKTLIVHSAHLWPFKKEENDTRIRLNEIKELVAAINYDLSKNSESVLLQGDLNHSPDMEEYQSLKNAGLVDTFIAAGIGDGYTINSIKPSKRIDFIYAVGALAGRIKSCKSLFEGNFRLNTEDPKGYALSDHLPVLVDFEL